MLTSPPVERVRKQVGERILLKQGNTWSSILMLALMVPSWIGVFDLPDAAENLFKLFPTYYLPETLDLSLAGKAASPAVWSYLAILAGSAVLVYILVVWVLGRQARA